MRVQCRGVVHVTPAAVRNALEKVTVRRRRIDIRYRYNINVMYNVMTL